MDKNWQVYTAGPDPRLMGSYLESLIQEGHLVVVYVNHHGGVCTEHAAFVKLMDPSELAV